jgi:hypothetical protein
VEVRRGRVAESGEQPVEGPEQFLWHGRLWTVSEVLAHWVETGPWWRSSGARAALGDDDPAGPGGPDGSGDRPLRAATDLVAEREVWRVEAARPGRSGRTGGVFDLVLDWADGSWRLARCLD